ncbi:hypothetical protein BSQ40_14285 [Serratia fonticola]|nr:hypothetical protein BSQ40_14285 [Serratia fonticola]
MVAARHRIHLTFFAPICNRRYKSVLAETIFVIEIAIAQRAAECRLLFGRRDFTVYPISYYSF